MGQKIRPDLLRLGIIKGWHSRWFGKKEFKDNLEEDLLIRKVINKEISNAGIVSIDIERNTSDCRIIIKAARPGFVIGRGGQGIENLTKAIRSKLEKFYIKKTGASAKKTAINIVVEELKRSEVAAVNVAQNIAWDLEKRMPFRRVMKRQIDIIMQNRDVQGIKIMLSGRLGGAEIARREWLSKGKLPLQTLRANVDYGETTAYTTYGTIGIKIWIYKGEVFDND